MKYLRAFFDRLIPGAVSDWMIVVIVCGLIWVAWMLVGEFALGGVLAFLLQGNNKERFA